VFHRVRRDVFPRIAPYPYVAAGELVDQFSQLLAPVIELLTPAVRVERSDPAGK
jgi:hypothetical protein